MPLRTLLFVIVIAVIGAFAVLNWSAFAANTVISLGFTSLEAPLGLIIGQSRYVFLLAKMRLKR
ncbi:MAG: hypothetical protein IPP76_07915 [Moraxellaceae bacterium]|nr:hypothetical protein [Moraxellaceae bacterium]